MLLRHFEDAEAECTRILAQPEIDPKTGRRIVMALPAYDQCIKASHLFNLLDARGVISVTERQAYIGRVRALAKACADAYRRPPAGRHERPPADDRPSSPSPPLFAAALVWFQVFAFYQRQRGVGALRIAGASCRRRLRRHRRRLLAAEAARLLPHRPRRRRRAGPGARRHAAHAALLVPLLRRRPAHRRPRLRRRHAPTTSPATRRAGFDLMLAVYPDGRGYLWRQLNGRYARLTMPQIQFPDFMAVTFGLVTYLLGEAINDRVPLLRRFNIPDPVTGGLLVALGFFALHEFGIAEVSFDTHARDLLLLMFFTGIGLNARLADLRQGRPAARHPRRADRRRCLILQNLVGGLGAWIAGLPMGMGVALGSTSLLGGHGTMIAWSPELAARGLAGAPEIGIAMATLGLVVASVIGGPLGRC